MITFVRHGRTTANAAGLLLGRRDPSLDDAGVDQARAVGAWLAAAGERPARIISSPLARTRETPQWPTVDELLWIMSDHGGNPICMTIDKAHFGQIWFIDHEVAEYEKPWTLAEAMSDSWGYVLPLTPTFSDFIAGLYEEAQ